MKRFLQIATGIVIVGLTGLYFLFNQTLPVSYGEIVLEGYYDGLVTSEDLKLYDNGVFSYSDGWTDWNGKYELKNDSIILDYYFPVDRPTIYLVEDDWINSYTMENGKKTLIHDLGIIKNELATIE